MLSYLHGFHAGNFADVQKHSALWLIQSMMQSKVAPVAFFDSHAGSAEYDLTDERARKTGEADGGIQRLWRNRETLSAYDDWREFLAPLHQYPQSKSDGSLTRYPGSPQWLARSLRPQDRLTAFELHPSEQSILKDWARAKSGLPVKVVTGDGFRGVVNSLPPREPRLLVLIDPPYEIRDDYATTASAVSRIWQKCRHAVVVVWYPILTKPAEQPLLDGLINSPVRKVLQCRLDLDISPERGMSGSGLLVANPPWGFAERFQSMMDSLGAEGVLKVHASNHWLIPE